MGQDHDADAAIPVVSPSSSTSSASADPKSSTFRQRLFLERAARVAQKSTMTHRHGCIIVASDDSIVSEGYNHHRKAMSHRFSIHAEVAALQKVKRCKTKKLAYCEMYVVRLGPSMERLKYSKPCDDCVKEITRAGIRRVYYSTSDEDVK
jgi:deoxycytidylate deaminase